MIGIAFICENCPQVSRLSHDGLIPSHGHIEVVVGERVRLAINLAPSVVEVEHAPAGAEVIVSGECVVVGRPGHYLVRVTSGLAEARITLVAFPAEALDDPRLTLIGRGADAGLERPRAERRLVLRALARELRPEQVEALTPERPLPPISLHAFGI